MEEPQMLTREQLAKRWGVTPKTIDGYEKKGIISRSKKVPVCRYPLEHIREVEGVVLDKMSPLERRRLERKIAELEQENNRMKVVLAKIQHDATIANFELMKGSEVS